MSIRDYDRDDAEALLAALVAREAREGRTPELRLSPEDLAAGAQVELEVYRIDTPASPHPIVIVRERLDPRRRAVERALEAFDQAPEPAHRAPQGPWRQELIDLIVAELEEAHR